MNTQSAVATPASSPSYRDPSDESWVIVELRGQPFAISAFDVREMLISPSVSHVPGTPDWIRGVINLRGQVIPLIDLRQRLGMGSALRETEELAALMQQREQDHKNWLAELEASVLENRQFTLTTDPHACAFGRWYDTFRTPNLVVSTFLKKFDEPHRRIHATAVEAMELASSGRTDAALGLIRNAREGVLDRLIHLFEELHQLLRESRREIAVVLSRSSSLVSVCVDSVLSVEKLAPGSLEELPHGVPGAQHGLARRIAKRTRTEQLALVLDSGPLFAGVAEFV